MRFPFYLLSMLLWCGCNPPTEARLDPASKAQDTLDVATNTEIPGDLGRYEHDLSMYNNKYFMSISPFINANENKYESRIVLTQQSDSIFDKIITLDSLVQTAIRSQVFSDSIDLEKFATDYEMTKIVYHGVRTNDLYFVADLKSKKDQEDVVALFQISYLYKNEIGKLFVNGFSTSGYGPNAGESKNKKNRKTPPTAKAS